MGLCFAGPPLHDALTILHLTHPHLLKGRRGKLTVDISKTEKDGETSFSPSSEEKFSSLDMISGEKNVESLVLEDLDVEAFFDVFLEVVERADEVVAKVEM
jgi:inosine-uridine nucleoside N-ribohydrolase